MMLIVNKAPANLVYPSTDAVLAVFPETGVYFVYKSDSAYTSSLTLPAKSVIVPIPGELTDIVGGYVRAERKEPLIDAVVPAASFELQTMTNKYIAPITLGFTPADGDLIRGTVNGVEVRGKWTGTKKTGGVALKRVDDPDTTIYSVRILDGKTVVVIKQDSAPTDYELHLYRYVPAGIVQIPQEYVEGLEATAADATEAKTAAETAQSTANSAKTTAETAKSTANAAKTTAETAQSTANSAKTTAETAQSTANNAKTTAESINTLGKTWTQSNITSGNFKNIVYANGLWVVGSNNNGLYYSTDGKTWTQSNITSGRFDAIVYANDLWVVGSNSGYGICYSTDGKTWTHANIASGYYFAPIVYANGLWVAGCGINKGLYYSTDGKTWTQSNITSGDFDHIVYANDLWVAGSNRHDGLYYSTDGKTWTQSNVTSGDFDHIVYANGLWVVGSNNNGLYYSASKYALTDTVDMQFAEIKQSIDEIKSADVILPSSTAGSTKKFKITVNDAGAISATEVTT